MHIQSAFIFVTLSYISLVQSNDIRLGFPAPHSRKLYSQITEAQPALWRRTDTIVVNGEHNEIISAIYVTDLRENKDGEAFIESGGIGGNSVTIKLKSPTILRGYKFEVEVFVEDLSQRFQSKRYPAHIFDDSQFEGKF